MSEKIKIVADDKIPYLRGVLEPYADVEYYPGGDITFEKVKDARAIITRTRTKCNSALLENSNVEFIATATIGIDHIDTSYCDNYNITWINAPGCNSYSVQQYFASALFTLAHEKKYNLNGKTIGIVGVGNVGSKIEKLARLIGLNVLLNDPPRERNEGNDNFVDLNLLIKNSDIITFHVPLYTEGIDKTFHMCSDTLFEKFRGDQIIINTSRGPVVDNNHLKTAIKNRIVTTSVIDVWENEPNIDLELLSLVDLATPHIAGYSADGKANGTAVSVRAISRYFNYGIPDNWYPPDIPAPQSPLIHTIDCYGRSEQNILYELFTATYDIKGQDDTMLRESTELFEDLRGNYPIRREFPFHRVNLIDVSDRVKKIISELGFEIIC